MPKSGPHPVNRLTAVFVKNTRVVGRHCDGNGLYLVVDQSGAKRWVARMSINGRRTDAGLGSARLVSLGEAREQARAIVKSAREGKDPILERRLSKRHVPTFREASELFFEERKSSFRNPKHAQQWIQTLRAYAHTKMGDRKVADLTTDDIYRCLSDIWLTKPETAKRLKQRISKVLDWSIARGHIKGTNVAERIQDILPPRPKIIKHYGSISHTEIRTFVQDLRAAPGSEPVKLGLELLVLTALRTNEAQRGLWQEINWEDKIWTIPAERQLKRKQPAPHVVPLSTRAIEILTQLKSLAGASEYIFPGTTPTKPISNMTFLMALKRLGRAETVHGFRSTFRTWVDEETDWSGDVAELALGHTIRNATEASYRRGKMLEKRRTLMEQWAEYVATPTAQVIKN